MIDAGVIVVAGVNLAVLAAAWGDMRRQVQGNRERQDERHAESQKLQDGRHEETRDMLKEISADVRRINGTVAAHTAKIEDHASEIRRLRP